jgi:hypothetical protein
MILLQQESLPIPDAAQYVIVAVVLAVVASLVFATVRVWKAVFSPTLSRAKELSDELVVTNERLSRAEMRERRCQRNLSRVVLVLDAQGIKLPDALQRDILAMEDDADEAVRGGSDDDGS